MQSFHSGEDTGGAGEYKYNAFPLALPSFSVSSRAGPAAFRPEDYSLCSLHPEAERHLCKLIQSGQMENRTDTHTRGGRLERFSRKGPVPEGPGKVLGLLKARGNT